MKSRRWKWIGLGAIAAIAAGAAFAAERRRRHWRDYDADEIRARLHERFRAADDTLVPSPGSGTPDSCTPGADMELT